MRVRVLLILLAGLAPAAVAGQGFGLGAHAGLNGFGADAGIGLSSRVVLRVGLSVAPENYFLTQLFPSDISGVKYDVLLPKTTLRAGFDLHILGPMRLMGGVMYRDEDLVTEATVTQSIDLGGTTYTQSGTVEARLDQNSLMPYAGIGFGNLSSGLGLYMDIGIAYSNETSVVMRASGDLAGAPDIDAALQQEADQFLGDVPEILKKLYPIVQIGLKFGF